MADEPDTTVQPPPTGAAEPYGGDAGSDPYAEHPEYFVGGALAAGFVVAQLLKRLGSD